ncbi:MAG: purine nucleoside permease [Pseudomonadota bacterium]
MTYLRHIERASMRIGLCLTGLLLLSACSAPTGGGAADTALRPIEPERSLATSAQDCNPGYACADPIPVKMVIVTMFEIGADEGDRPGEFQLWKERLELDTRFAFPHGHHDLYFNPSRGILGMVTGVGTLHSASGVMALGLDQRFDLSQAYWLIAGIAGIDPEDASLGSAVWSAYLVDGDLAHEIDPREMPAQWEDGYLPRRTRTPYEQPRPEARGELLVTNQGLRDWAYELTRRTPLPDNPQLAAARSAYTEHPNAQRPPFVTTGGHIAAMTFWHGALLNDWANRWVHYWSDGATDFVTSAMEDTGTFQALTYLHNTGRVDKHRALVLRAGSNYTMPPPGVTAAENLLAENQGYSGMTASLEALYAVGSVVVDEITGNWTLFADQVPGRVKGHQEPEHR